MFAPKYRRQVIYGKLKQDIGKILRRLCENKNVEIIEAEACKDHIHMLVTQLSHLEKWFKPLSALEKLINFTRIYKKYLTHLVS